MVWSSWSANESLDDSSSSKVPCSSLTQSGKKIFNQRPGIWQKSKWEEHHQSDDCNVFPYINLLLFVLLLY